EAGSPVAASAVLTSSGTMSLQCALAGIPGAIAYRAHPLTYVMGRMLLRVKYLGIANLLLGEAMYPEYLQGAATGDALAGELRLACEDAKRIGATKAQADSLRKILLHPAGITASGWVEKQLAQA
ncbi:MAG TPA: lipid-A-disaccharide synthase, partial [Opitutaceae bacterium]|nr:lipid-A-disaccharide synthase [Opitutaceae bacterium]